MQPDDRGDAFAAAPQLEQLMKISGISKFTHLSCSESELHFGEILVGAPNTVRAPTEREFMLRNRSLVRASFEITRVERDLDPVFVFSPLRGVVPPESTLTVKVRYTPLSAGTFTCDHFDVRTPGGNTVRLTCKGRAVGPHVSIWKKNTEANFVTTSSINFQDVLVGKPTARVITLRNESPVEVLFHFTCQPRGVFHFDCVAGRIPPCLDLNVTVTFTPTSAGNFYRRVFLLVQNQSTLFVDVLGTGYDDKTRPSPFQQAHVNAYYERARAGLALLSPDQLETYWQDHGDELFLQGALRRIKHTERTSEAQSGSALASVSSASSLPPTNQILTRSGEAAIADVEVCHEFFVSVDDKRNAVVVHNATLDFGNCGIVQFPSKKTLSVMNNTHGKVTCTWRVSMASGSGSDATSTAAGSKIFQVFPESADIAAGASAEFRIAFQPVQSNAYYFAELEGYVAFKSNRTFRLVNVETFAPPWCILASVCGNTFASPTEQFLSKLSFRLPSKQQRRVHFPPCYLGDSVFQTILMENASDTPALFAFVPDASEVFACKPVCGYIAAKSFHLVQLRFSPRHVRTYTHALQCIVNNARSRPETIELTGICALPALAFDDGSSSATPAPTSSSYAAKVFIKPTAIGLESVRTIMIANVSRVPLVYRWDVPRKHESVFRVTPKLGRLNGNESVVIACAFAPAEIRDYVSRFSVAVKPISVPWRALPHHATKIAVLQESTVKVQTKGTVGAIVFEPEALQFETILVNTSARQSFCIVNVADCDLEFALHQRVDVETAQSESGVAAAAAGDLTFSESRGRIAAHSRKKITATFVPHVAAKFTFAVSCEVAAATASSNVSTLVAGLQQQLSAYDRWSSSSLGHNDATSRLKMCTIRAEASFPTVVIDDIRVSQLPSQLAWCQFQCHELNEYLSAPLSRDEELAATAKSAHTPRSHGASPSPRQRLPNAAASIDTSAAGDASDASDASLRRFAIPFSPAALGSPSEKVYVKLRNPGSLVVQFRLRYPKEGNVEIEHWAETGAPSSEEVRLNAIIDSKVFGIAPRRATLLPRQSVLLALSYSYASDAYGGVHDLPIYLEVDKGKRMVLELQGHTLARGEPKLFVPQRVFHLSPVMIGEHRRFVPHSSALPTSSGREYDSDDETRGEAASGSRALARPPVQQIEVFNRGESAFRLEVGSNAFAKVNAEQFDYPVLRCATTSEIVPAKSSVFVEIEFNPIAAARVEANLILKAHGLMGRGYKEAVMLTVVATGYHPRLTTLAQVNAALASAAIAVSSAPPKKQLVAVPDQSVRFVSDFVDFGHVPMYSQLHQLLVLENHAESASGELQVATFEWDTTHVLVANGMLQFAPKSGELAPGESAIVRVTVLALSDAMVVNHDVACFVTYRPANASTSPTKGSSSLPLSVATRAGAAETEPKPRASVINRSTATQEAAGDKSKLSRMSAAGMSPAALGGKSSLRKPGTTAETKAQLANNSKSSRRGDIETDATSNAPLESSGATSLFVRIYAHVLPQRVFEATYSRERVTEMPVPLVVAQTPRPQASAAPRVAAQTPSASTPATTTATARTGRSVLHTPLTAASSRSRGIGGHSTLSTLSNGAASASAAATSSTPSSVADKPVCRDVLYDVFDMLVVDVLNSSTVQDALERQTQSLPAPARALAHVRTTTARCTDTDSSTSTSPGSKDTSESPPLLLHARKSDDCHTILGGILENTVLNILHELFHGDLEHELSCVPRKAVFPMTSNASSPTAKRLLSI